MDKIYIILIIVAALALLYILWCLTEPFFLDSDKTTLRKSPKDLSPVDKRNITKLPLVQDGITGDPDFRFVFFSDTHAEWCPVSSKRICDLIRKSNETAGLVRDRLALQGGTGDFP